MALSFHQASPLHLGPFVHLDCPRDEARLASALQDMMAEVSADPGFNPIRSAWCGTLFLDRIGSLSAASQRLLLCFAQRSLGGVAAQGGWPVRLAAGHDESLETALEDGAFLPELSDELDKIHVSLEPQPLLIGMTSHHGAHSSSISAT